MFKWFKNHHVYIRVLHTSPLRLYWLLFIEHCFVLIQSSQSAVMTWSHLVSQHVNGEYRCTFAHYHFQKQVCSQSDSCWCVIGQSMAPGCSSPNTVCVRVCVCVLFVLLQLPVEWMTVCLLLIKHWVIVHTVGWCLPAGWLQQCVKTNGRFRNDRAVR